jgi:anthranilate synthase component 2
LAQIRFELIRHRISAIRSVNSRDSTQYFFRTQAVENPPLAWGPTGPVAVNETKGKQRPRTPAKSRVNSAREKAVSGALEPAFRKGDTSSMLLLIDNYDSFTYNLFHYLGELGEEVVVTRNDQISVPDALALRPDSIVLSPGPCDPDKAGICLPLITAAAGQVPILGVCLGHQAIGQAYGGKIVRAPVPMHGKLSDIHHGGKSVFLGLEDGFRATRYHSLVVERASLPSSLEITAQTDDGLIMGVAHKSHPVHGVQFHPESIASQHGHALLKNFLRLARTSRKQAS